MNTHSLTPLTQPDYRPIIDLVLNSFDSEHSQRAYERALTLFMAWYQASGHATLNKATVQAYTQHLKANGLSAATINQRLSAVRKLANEAADNGLLDPTLAQGITRVKGIRKEGHRLGNWLDKRQAQALLHSPNTATLKGLRDRALLAVLLGAGLRREEAANLTVDHIQQRDGRWVIIDLTGKRNKTRSVPIASWVKVAIDEWTTPATITNGRIFRPINKGDHLSGEQMTPQAIFDAVKHYAGQTGVDIAPHDLRRTFAQLARKGGADIEQISLSLGHASIKTTEIYLGTQQDLTDAPADHLGLRL